MHYREVNADRLSALPTLVALASSRTDVEQARLVPLFEIGSLEAIHMIERIHSYFLGDAKPSQCD